MSHYETLYPGRFLKKEALPAPKVIRIVAVTTAELENEKGRVEQKVTVKYKAADGDGEIVWCKSNAVLTAFALGTPEYEQWVGKLITIANDPNVKFGGKKVGGVRVVGSPEMKAPKRVEVKMPRKSKPDVYDLKPTDMKGNPKAVANAAPTLTTEPEPPPFTDADVPAFEDGPDIVNGEVVR